MDFSWIPFYSKLGNALGYLSFLTGKRLGCCPTSGLFCGSLTYVQCYSLHPIFAHLEELPVIRPASVPQTLVHFSVVHGQLVSIPLVRFHPQHYTQVGTQHCSALYPAVIHSLIGGTYCSSDVVSQPKPTYSNVLLHRNSTRSTCTPDQAVLARCDKVNDPYCNISDSLRNSDVSELFYLVLSNRSSSILTQDRFPGEGSPILEDRYSDELCLHRESCYPYTQHNGRAEQLNIGEVVRTGTPSNSLRCYRTIFVIQSLDMTLECMTSTQSEYSLHEFDPKYDWSDLNGPTGRSVNENCPLYGGDVYGRTFLHEERLPERPPGHLEVSICNSFDECPESDTLEILTLLENGCFNSPCSPENLELSDLFIQNSAVDLDPGSDTVPSKPVYSVTARQSAPLNQSVSDNDARAHDSASNQEAKLGSLVHNLPQDVTHEAMGLYIATACSPDLNSQELQLLQEVPPEFAAAELRVLRAVRTVHSNLEIGSLHTSPLLSRQRSLSETPKRSSILVKLADDTTNQRSAFKRAPSRTDGPIVLSPKLQRTSLSMVCPPQRPLFDRDQDSVDDKVDESRELGSRITMSWATVDSTDISRGVKLIDFGAGTSSSEMLDNFEKSKNLLGLITAKDEAVQFDAPPPPSSIHRPLVPSQYCQLECNLTPSIHCCDLGQTDEGLCGLQHFPRSTAAIAKLRKSALLRTRAKYERFPFVTSNSTFGLFSNFCHKYD